MTKFKIIASVLAVLGIGSFACYISYVGSTMTLEKKFPDVPSDIVWKVHNEMVKEALSGKYKDYDINSEDDPQMDAIFLEKVKKYTS